MLRTKRFHSVVRLGSEYITCRSFSPCKILVTLRSINALAEREIARPNHLSVLRFDDFDGAAAHFSPRQRAMKTGPI